MQQHDVDVVPLKGENDIEQLCCVLKVLGTPNEESWPVSKYINCM